MGKVRSFKKLMRLYVAARRQETGTRMYMGAMLNSPMVCTCFKKLVVKLEDLEEGQHISINEKLFIRAQVEFFKDDILPTHLIAACAYPIYEKYMNAHVVRESTETTPEMVNEMLTYLAEIRHESVEQVKSVIKGN